MVASTLPKLIGFDSDVWEKQISFVCLQESCLREGLLELIVEHLWAMPTSQENDFLRSEDVNS